MYSLRDVTESAHASNCESTLSVGNLRNGDNISYSSEDLNYRVLPQLPDTVMNQANRNQFPRFECTPASLPCTGSASAGSSCPMNWSYFCSNVGMTMQPLLNRHSSCGMSQQPLSRCSASRSAFDPTTPWFNIVNSAANYVPRLSIHDDNSITRFTQPLPVTACRTTMGVSPFCHSWINSGSGHPMSTTAQAQQMDIMPANIGMTSYNVLGNISNNQVR